MKENNEIYTVPSSLYKSKSKFIFNTVQTKELLMAKAIRAHEAKKFKKAYKYYDMFLKRGFTDPIILSNFAVICTQFGQINKAKNIYQRSLELFPNNQVIYANLGALLRDIGNLQEAEFYIRKAIEIKPNDATSYLNLALLSKDLYKYKEAEYMFKKAIEIKSDYLDSYVQLGMLLVDLNKYDEAFNYFLKSIKLSSKSSYIYFILSNSINVSNPSFINSAILKKSIKLLLDRNDISHKKLFRSFKYIYRNKIKIYLDLLNKNNFKEDSFEKFINDELLIKALEKMIFQDPEWERVLTKVREYICNGVINKKIILKNEILKFTCALAQQCYLNEYVYSIDHNEMLMINKIINIFKSDHSNYENLSLICCYYPLYKIGNEFPLIESNFLLNQDLHKLLLYHLQEPLKELSLAKEIKQIIASTNKISNLIKAQYQENPYPRWRYSHPFKEKKFSYVEIINSEIKPNLINNFLKSDNLNILIAGCGTGQQILDAQRYSKANITGIDLSASSLAFTQRKINEIGINNVELIQMDILDIHLLNKTFDIIECGGVLHHMHSPSDGLKALLGALKTPGYLKLGLYSELGRQDIINVRRYLKKHKIKPTIKNIINFRKKIISGRLEEFKDLKLRGDFYTTSSCRDLCFNYHEHRFTINQIIETLHMNQLEFMGFQVPNDIQLLYKQLNPDDKKHISLENWSLLEEKYPNIFSSMYQFWVAKK